MCKSKIEYAMFGIFCLMFLTALAILWMSLAQEPKAVRPSVIELHVYVHSDTAVIEETTEESFIIEKEVFETRNNNPCNIHTLSNGELWAGQIGEDKAGHAVFSSIEYGLRAAAFTLRTYACDHKLKTVNSILRRFSEAPSKEYISFLSGRLGVQPDEKFDVIGNMPVVLQALCKFESGVDIPDELIAPYDILTKLSKGE